MQRFSEVSRGSQRVFRGFLRDPLRGRFPSQRLSVLLPLSVLTLELSPTSIASKKLNVKEFILCHAMTLALHSPLTWRSEFLRNTPSAAVNSMTGSERPSPEPLLKKEASSAALGRREFWIHALEPSNALNYRAWGDPTRTLEGNCRKCSKSVSGVFPEALLKG